MEHFYKNPQFGENWFTYPNLYKYFVDKLHNGSVIVEVGSWKGKSAAYMGVEIINSKKEIKFYCVDTWMGNVFNGEPDGSEVDSLYNLFISNTEPIKNVINPIRKTSIEASSLFENNSIDVVFIDANHSYETVKEDIAAWEPKVKIGGVLAGHDYSGPGYAGVVQAVDEFMKNKSFYIQEGCWIWNKI